MTDGINAAMNRVQPAEVNSMIDHIGRKAGGEQLTPCHYAVLPLTQYSRARST